MGTDAQVTNTTQIGSEQEVEVKEATGAAPETAVEQTPEEISAAEEAAKVEAAAKVKREEESTYKKINRTIKELKNESRAERDARHAAEVRAARLEGQLEAMQQGKGGEQKPDPNAAPVRPSKDDFETEGEYSDANTAYLERRQDWLIEQDRMARKKELDEIRRGAPTLAETPEQKYEREVQGKIRTTMEKVREEYGEDAIETLTADIKDTDFRFTNLMRDTTFEKDNATKILGFFAENPKVAAKISTLSLAEQVREIDKLSATLKAKKETAALPPLTHVDGKGGGGKVDTSKMTDPEYAAYRRQQKINSA